jgi:hypothetical protein
MNIEDTPHLPDANESLPPNILRRYAAILYWAYIISTAFAQVVLSGPKIQSHDAPFSGALGPCQQRHKGQ